MTLEPPHDPPSAAAKDDAGEADRQLLARLRVLAGGLDAVSPDVPLAARQAYALRSLDEELAELVADTLDTFGTLQGVRGPLAARLLSYESGGVTIEVEVTAGPRGRGLVGQVTGVPGPVLLELSRVGSPVRRPLDVDELGRFVVDDVPAGSFRLHCTTLAGVRVVTSWTTI